MAFVKLDCGMLRSTLWMDRVSREVFITALLMAEPREFDAELEQIEVQSLSLTGYVFPPGWYGFVDAAGVGIVRASLVEADLGIQALERLCGPEPESRSAEFDGRRMARINGGYIVLNYMKYRDKDHTSAERARRYRLRKASRVTPAPSHRDITQAEAEAHAEAKAEIHKERVSDGDGWKTKERCAALYPAGTFRGTAWITAEREIRGLLEAGEDAEVIVTRTGEYAAQCIAKGSVGTQYVLSPAKFYKDEWRGPFPLPLVKTATDKLTWKPTE